MQVLDGSGEPISVRTETELLTTIGDLIGEFVENNLHDRKIVEDYEVQALKQMIVDLRVQVENHRTRYVELTDGLNTLASLYRVEADTPLGQVERIRLAAKRQGHDAGFIAGLQHAVSIAQKYGSPFMNEISATANEFENKREKYDAAL